MTAARPAIACLGAGRMGRGIAVAFAYAGHAVTMIDVKARSVAICHAQSRGAGRSWQDARKSRAIRIADGQ
jgi:3-hydroxyacyl-CoA dehydrogenase